MTQSNREKLALVAGELSVMTYIVSDDMVSKVNEMMRMLIDVLNQERSEEHDQRRSCPQILRENG